MIKIVQKENVVLRKRAKPVPKDKISSPKIQKLLKKMKEALDSQEDGVALAAPQVGESLRIFIVSEKIFNQNETEEKQPAEKEAEFLVYINPKITKLSKKKEYVDEGCLSVRWLYGKTNRSKQITVKAYDEKGNHFTRGASGLLAQIFQHETDHLDGILFTDKAKELKKLNPEEWENRSGKNRTAN